MKNRLYISYFLFEDLLTSNEAKRKSSDELIKVETRAVVFDVWVDFRKSSWNERKASDARLPR
jgi:hypothetical protein